VDADILESISIIEPFCQGSFIALNAAATGLTGGGPADAGSTCFSSR
jgi:hypothetical protein